MLQCVVVRFCSVLQCGAVCCSVLQLNGLARPFHLFELCVAVQPIPIGMTFSRALSTLKAESSNVFFAAFE